ncbi:ATP-binding protein [Streptomyces sp. NPDC056255]|uniref:ATP-binding protein n=1 Tax=Streptomyces sp. NPDC056255 TaxID=3345764 RepID=UPI0035DD26EB
MGFDGRASFAVGPSLRQFLAVGLYEALVAVLGVGVAFATRHPAGALSILVTLLWALPSILLGLGGPTHSDVNDRLPHGAGGHFMRLGGRGTVRAGDGGLIVAAWAAAAHWSNYGRPSRSCTTCRNGTGYGPARHRHRRGPARTGGRLRSAGALGAARGDARAVPPGPTGRNRTVQESLTNAVKHAPDGKIHVRIAHEADRTRVSVVNAAPPADRPAFAAEGPTIGTGGRGLTGLRERMTVLGGSLWTGPYQGGSVSLRSSLTRSRPVRRRQGRDRGRRRRDGRRRPRPAGRTQGPLTLPPVRTPSYRSPSHGSPPYGMLPTADGVDRPRGIEPLSRRPTLR